MAFPDDLTMVTVTHTIADAALRPLPGVVVATPTGRQWKQGEGSILPAEYTAPIEGGTWTLVLPAVDQFINLEAYKIEERPTEGGKPWGRHYHIAPTLDHAPGPVDATDVITTPPRGGDIVFTTGPATDESMAQVAADPDSAFSTEMKSIFASKASEPVVDTSVGTRVMIDGVMVYGDTGWRDITSTATDALAPSNTGTIQLKREGSTVSLALRGVSLLSGDGPLVMGPLWQGFLPTTNRFLSSVASASGGSFEANEFIVLGQYVWVARRKLDTGEVSQTRTSDPIIGVITYTTSHLWPSSLPGTPA